MSISDLASVLIIDDDYGTQVTFATAFKSAGYQVSSAMDARIGTALGKQLQPTVAVIDVRLPDGDGISVLRALRQFSPATAVIMITGFATTRTTVEAMQLGAAHFLEKPVDIDELLAVVNQFVSAVKRTSHHKTDAPLHALDRWVSLMNRTIDLPSDPNTVALWARATANSAGALRAWCRAAHLPVKGSLNLARMMRVLAHFDGHTAVGDLLNIIDTRTLVRFLRLGSSTTPPATLPIGIDEFLERQRWIAHPAALARLRRAWSTRFRTPSHDDAPAADVSTATDVNARH